MTAIAPAHPQARMAHPEDPSNGSHASYVPHDLKYSQEFEDSLIDAVLHPEDQRPGIRILPNDSDESPIEGESIRASSILPHTLPHIPEEELPLPLNDPRRIYAGPVPGVRLTHPGGYLEGGPGLDPEMDTFPDDFLSSHPGVKTAGQLQRALDKEMEAAVEALKERLRVREEARAKNESLSKELATLTETHELELKIQKRIKEDLAKKKEAREKKRRESGGPG